MKSIDELFEEAVKSLSVEDKLKLLDKMFPEGEMKYHERSDSLEDDGKEYVFYTGVNMQYNYW